MEGQPQDDVLVFGRAHIFAELVDDFPEGLFEGLVVVVFGHSDLS